MAAGTRLRGGGRGRDGGVGCEYDVGSGGGGGGGGGGGCGGGGVAAGGAEGAVGTKGTIGAAVVVAAVVVVVGSVQPTFGMGSADEELLHPKEDLTRSVTTYDMSLNSPRIVDEDGSPPFTVKRKLVLPPFTEGVKRYSICLIGHEVAGDNHCRATVVSVRRASCGIAGADGRPTVSTPHSPHVFLHNFLTCGR